MAAALKRTVTLFAIAGFLPFLNEIRGEYSTSQSQFVQTGYLLNFAIAGSGFFVVRDPNSEQVFATRAGDFILDSNQYIATPSGFRVQGFIDWKLEAVGDIRIDGHSRPRTVSSSAGIASVSIDESGAINVVLVNGESYVRAQILLQSFAREVSLRTEPRLLFSSLDVAEPLTELRPPGTDDLGIIRSGFVEIIDVEPRISQFLVGRFSQGDIIQTGIASDLAIAGQGFFLVRDSADNRVFATRSGKYTVDPLGYLTTTSGFRLQGFADQSLTTIGDLRIDELSSISAASTSEPFGVDTDGRVFASVGDTPNHFVGQVLLQSFSQPEYLVDEGDSLFSGLSKAAPMKKPAAPGTNGLGLIVSGALERLHPKSEFRFGILVTGRLTSTYTIEWSSDLREWTNLSEVTISSYDGKQYVDQQPRSVSLRFYRLRQ